MAKLELICAQSLAKADFGVDVEVFSESDAENYVSSSNKPKIAKLKYYICVIYKYSERL